MDPLTHGLLGAVTAQTASRNKRLRIAALAGALGAMAPDLDIFLHSATDPLFSIVIHRQFTHSFLFVPLGGLIVALFWWPFLRKQAPFLIFLLFTTLGYATHGLLDACTNYGTHLLWPFSNERVSWNTVSIIDPLVTLTLFLGVILSVKLRNYRPAAIAGVLMLTYLILGYAQRERVEGAMEQLATLRGHTIIRAVAQPTLGNSILWKGIYEADDGYYYTDGVRAGLFSGVSVYKGARIKKADPETVFPELGNDSTARNDIRRFAFFANGFIGIHPEQADVIADYRYSTLPQIASPLWGIRVDRNHPENHVSRVGFRRDPLQVLPVIWRMVSGQEMGEKITNLSPTTAQ